MSPRQSERSQPSEFDYRVRLYQNEDNKEVQALYLNAMVWQSHSPLVPYIKVVATTTVAKFLYLISLSGAVIWFYYPTLGRTISLIAGGTAFLRIGIASRRMLSVMRENVNEDLISVAEHYMLVPDVKAHGALKTSGPRGFWVVEATHRVTGEKELAGIGGLDIIKNGETNEAELRRLAVLSRHTRRGVAGMVLKAVVAHAKAHGLPSVYLVTSSVQGAAEALYRKHGWIEEERQEAPFSCGAKGYRIYMRLRFGG